VSGAHPRDQPLQGKAAVVTGAGRGIGRAIAVGYAAAGASVCCAARIREQIEETAARIRENGGRGIAVAADVTDREAVEKMFEAAAEALGGVGILVANAGGNLESRHPRRHPSSEAPRRRQDPHHGLGHGPQRAGRPLGLLRRQGRPVDADPRQRPSASTSWCRAPCARSPPAMAARSPASTASG
jgi:NAD(P)-dependent dehydrogenase (short-subunit alcohol dehydrogenase family)